MPSRYDRASRRAANSMPHTQVDQDIICPKKYVLHVSALSWGSEASLIKQPVIQRKRKKTTACAQCQNLTGALIGHTRLDRSFKNFNTTISRFSKTPFLANLNFAEFLSFQLKYVSCASQARRRNYGGSTARSRGWLSDGYRKVPRATRLP